MTVPSMTQLLRRFAVDESGASAVEYAVLAALIATVIIGATTRVGTALEGVFNNVANRLTNMAST